MLPDYEMNQSGVPMADAASSFLNLPLRTESQAQAVRAQAEQERHRRLEQHGAAFCHRVLAGAFERVYQADGSYRLREIQSGAWLEDLPAADLATCQNPISPPALPPVNDAPSAAVISKPAPSRQALKIMAARHFGYAAALRDLSHWISEAAISPRMDANTLGVLNDHIAKLSNQAKTTTIASAPSFQSTGFGTQCRELRDPG